MPPKHLQVFLINVESDAKIFYTSNYAALLTKQNGFYKEIKRRLNPGNSCYHYVQNLLSSMVHSKHVKFRTNKAVTCEISDFQHVVDENCTFQGYYAACSRQPISHTGLLDCPKMSVRNYHHTLHNSPE